MSRDPSGPLVITYTSQEVGARVLAIVPQLGITVEHEWCIGASGAADEGFDNPGAVHDAAIMPKIWVWCIGINVGAIKAKPAERRIAQYVPTYGFVVRGPSTKGVRAWAPSSVPSLRAA